MNDPAAPVAVFDRAGAPIGTVLPAKLHPLPTVIRVLVQRPDLAVEIAVCRSRFCPTCFPVLYHHHKEN